MEKLSNLPVKIEAPVKFTPPEKLTIFEVIEKFVVLKESEQTKRAYRKDLQNFFSWLGIQKLLDLHLEILPFPVLVDKVNEYVSLYKKVDKFKPDKVLNAKTVQRKAYSLSAFFRYLIRMYDYPKNPVEGISLPKVQKKSTTVSLGVGEVRDLLTYLKDKHTKREKDFRDYLIFLFLYVLALRRDELVNLEWSDIVHGSPYTSITVRQKGGTTKILPIPTNVMALLTEFHRLYNPDGQIKYIFRPVKNNRTKEFNKPLRGEYILVLVKKVVGKVLPEKAHLITPHSFRKSFIEEAFKRNEDIGAIQNATGHSYVGSVIYYDTRDTLKNNAIHGAGSLV